MENSLTTIVQLKLLPFNLLCVTTLNLITILGTNISSPHRAAGNPGRGSASCAVRRLVGEVVARRGGGCGARPGAGDSRLSRRDRRAYRRLEC